MKKTFKKLWADIYKAKEKNKKINKLKEISNQTWGFGSIVTDVQIMYRDWKIDKNNSFYKALPIKQKAWAVAMKWLKTIKEKEDTKKMVNKNRIKIAAKEVVKKVLPKKK